LIGYNPQHQINPQGSIWLNQPCRIDDLAWDPREWQWKAVGNQANKPIFEYTTKQGYRIGIVSRIKPTRYETKLRANGLTLQERKRTYSRMWHGWLPKKVSTFLWLLQIEGLPLGSWLARMDIEGSCKMCTQAPLETAQHAFVECQEVKRAWIQYNMLRSRHPLPPIQLPVESIIEGNARLGGDRHRFNNTCEVTEGMPWDLLRCLLLWQIWYQRCSKVMREEPFHLDTALHNAWRTMIHIMIAIWRGIGKSPTTE